MPKADNPLSANKAKEVDKRRVAAFERFFGLTEKALKHIESGLDAVKTCVSCTVREGVFYPGKFRTEDGKCGFCLNLGVVPDLDQRNWASLEITERVAPKPKSVEMAVETTNKIELEKEAASLSDVDLDKQLAALGISVAENNGPKQ